VSRATDSELLERFQPCLRYDSLECYFADSAEEWTLNPGNRLRRSGAHGKVLATAGEALSLDFLRAGAYPGGEKALSSDLIEASGDDYDDQYQRLRRENQALRNLFYGRVVRGAHDTWLQYWFFYFLNDYRLAWGSGVHEGDWEMVQFKLDAAESVPEIAVYAQHSFCEVRTWPDVRRLAEEMEEEGEQPSAGDRDRPLVYVGRGSHASYFTPGYHPTDFYDVTDGRRRPKTEVKLEVVAEDTHPWLWWPGYWGGSRAGAAGPSAPCEHDQWTNPDSLLKKSPVVPERPSRPGEPRLWARRRRNRLLIEFDFSPMAAPPRRLIATVNSEDEATVPPRAFRLTLHEVILGSLQTRIELDPDKHYDVSVAVVDADGRSTLAQLFFFAPSRGLLGLRRRITAGFGRLVHLARLVFGGGD
jgi:hypothetical protein